MKDRTEKVLGIILALLSLGILTAKVSSPASDSQEKRSTQQDQHVQARQARVVQNYGKLPLSFEPNQGQTDQRVKFLAHGQGYGLFLTRDAAVLELRGLGVRNQESEENRPSSSVSGPLSGVETRGSRGLHTLH